MWKKKRNKIEQFSLKTGHLASLIRQERLQNKQKWKTHVQSMQNEYLNICEVLVALIAVVA